MNNVQAHAMPRTGRGTGSSMDDEGPSAWSDVEASLRSGSAVSWLSIRGRSGGVRTRPIYAAWGGTSFFFASKASSAKTGDLQGDGAVSLAIDLITVHLVVEGTAGQLTADRDLRRASGALRDVFGWPTQVIGEELDAPYAAPTSGGPPFQAWELTPARAFAFPTQDQVEPTRFVFPTT